MRTVTTLICLLGAVILSSVGVAQVNLKPLEDKGLVTTYKLKPYKKTKNQVLKLKIKNGTEKFQKFNFQLYLYVDGVAESMSEQKNECLAPNKKVKYRFLFEPQNIGVNSVELEKFDINEFDSCSEE